MITYSNEQIIYITIIYKEPKNRQKNLITELRCKGQVPFTVCHGIIINTKNFQSVANIAMCFCFSNPVPYCPMTTSLKLYITLCIIDIIKYNKTL